MDTFTTRQRSEVMRRVRAVDTGPEMTVRRLVHAMGFRYRLHCRELPGKPDLVFPRRKKIIFVHGCFWHSHSCRAGRNRPVTHKSYWMAKLERNRLRDRANRARLKRAGWDVLVVWECRLKDTERLRGRLRRFLEG
jgi:DNA mismatch endonuclease (patch repair protein)